MMITRDNYEPFFLDYLEGNLDENKIDQFLDFLEHNPDLKEELHLFENIHLPEEQAVFSGKEHLYKTLQDVNTAFDMKAIAFMEGDLKDEERESFETYLANHPELQKEYSLFAKTRVVADTELKYPEKQKLYKKSGITIVMHWFARVAAVIVIVWGIGSLFQSESQKVQHTVMPEFASVKAPSVLPSNKLESEIEIQEIRTGKKLAKNTNPKQVSNQEPTKVNPDQKPAANENSPERDIIVLEEITTILAKLEVETSENRLAVSRSINVEKINDPHNIMTLDEFLASRAKKVGDEGILSVQRIFRTGLSVASEISGNRIGYSVTNGKISSVGFESRLMAFSIPMQKK